MTVFKKVGQILRMIWSCCSSEAPYLRCWWEKRKGNCWRESYGCKVVFGPFILTSLVIQKEKLESSLSIGNKSLRFAKHFYAKRKQPFKLILNFQLFCIYFHWKGVIETIGKLTFRKTKPSFTVHIFILLFNKLQNSLRWRLMYFGTIKVAI